MNQQNPRFLWIVRRATAFLVMVSCIALEQGASQSGKNRQSFLPATGQTFYLDLDTPGGSFSEWRHDDLRGICALHASVNVPRIRTDPKWGAIFSIWLQGSAIGDRARRVGLQFYSENKRAPLHIRVVQFDDGPKLVANQELNTTLGLNVSVPVEMTWMPRQPLMIKIGQNEVHSLKIPWKIERITITASTGEMKIDPLVLGCIQGAPVN